MKRFSMARLGAIMHKEFLLMKRDPAVIVIMAVLPLILVCLAGYTVNINPKNAPTVIVNFDRSTIARQYVDGLRNTGYFKIIKETQNEHLANQLMKTGKALFVVTIPPDFSQKLIRGEQPSLLLEGDATNVIAVGPAFGAAYAFNQQATNRIIPDSLAHLKTGQPSFQVIFHRRYNPTMMSQYNIVPGIIGLVLMLTMLMITTIIAFRDKQGGTLECLLASPTRPLEILSGEILSYLLIGFFQLFLGVLVAHYLFHIPFQGSPWLLGIATLPYLIAELSLGLTIATFCSSQFQAIQINNIFIAISIILTGFSFPIFGMPHWAQVVSDFVPLTHFLRILRGIMLKGSDFHDIWQNIWPLMIYFTIMLSIAIGRFQKTLK